jgi:hypothetical protein
MIFFSTSGHGYLRISINQLKAAYRKGFVPTSYSMFSKSQVLLEEDCDAPEYMKVMFGDKRQEKFNNIKTKYQNTISHNYMSTPPTLNQFEEMVAIYNPNNYSLSMIMTDDRNNKYEIIGSQKNGYIYYSKVDNCKYNMPFHRITKIEKVEVAA